jgi:UMF1 family MFS transporter
MKVQKRFAWYMYDWSSSAFTTTVVTVFLGPYLTNLAQNQAGISGMVDIAGISIAAGSFFPYCVSISVLLQALLLPIIASIADKKDNKQGLLLLCATIGSVATMGFYGIDSSVVILGGLLFILANTAYGASIVFYNAMLLDIAEQHERDEVSSKGFAFGYLGGGLLLLLNILFFLQKESFGIDTGHAVRICLASAGIWWLIFTVIPFVFVSKEPSKHKVNNTGLNSWKQLLETCKQLKKYPQTLLFLLAFTLYNDGIQTVISMSAQFGQEELGLSLAELQGAILLVQFIALFGALIFNKIAQKTSTKTSILISLCIWGCVILYGHAFLPKNSAMHFYALSSVIAIVLGGSQALSRSYFSSIIPKGKETEYFSFYELTDRGTSWLGPLAFGLAFQYSGSYRIALLILLVFFISGALLLLSVHTQKAQQAILD